MNTGNTTYRFAAGVALAAALILVWLSLGVGIIGRDFAARQKCSTCAL